MSRFPTEKPEENESWKPWKPARKRICKPVEDADDVETTTKVAAQAVIHYALITSEQDTTTEVNTTTSQPRMIGTKEIFKESAKDTTTKELKQMLEEGASKDAEDWPKALRNHHVKDANYIVVEDTVLINGKAIIPTNLRSQILL